MSKDETLVEMIARCRKGEAAGFVWLLEEYGPRLYSYFLRSTGSTADAEDLLQDLFVRLLKKVADYQHEGVFDNWLFRIAANLVRDRGRRQQRQSPAQTGPGREEDDYGPPLENLTARGPTAAHAAELAEEIGRLQKALEELPRLDREIILLRHYGQMSFKDIARQCGIPLGTALAKVHRGLKTLNRILSNHERK